MKKRAVVFLSAIIILTACGRAPRESMAANGNGISSAIAVQIKQLVPEVFTHHFDANGSLEAEKDAFISPEMGGQIQTIHVREGERVRDGQLLVSLNSEVIDRSITEVKTSLQLARTVYEKRRGLWEKKIGSEIQYLEAKTQKEALENKLNTLQAQLEKMRITAPIDGIVDEIARKEGELSVPGVLLVRVVDLKKMLLKADVSEAYLAKIVVGDPVEVTFPSFPGYTVKTKIHRIGSVINPENRTFEITVLLDNPGERLKPNMLAVATMQDYTSEKALIVPSIVIKKDINGSYVYVVSEQGNRLVAEKRYVEPGISAKTETLIKSGLDAGLRVITKGYNLVKNGAEIQISE